MEGLHVEKATMSQREIERGRERGRAERHAHKHRDRDRDRDRTYWEQPGFLKPESTRPSVPYLLIILKQPLSGNQAFSI